MALDSLASELDALRSHWETTNSKHFRSSLGTGENSHASSRGGGLGAGNGSLFNGAGLHHGSVGGGGGAGSLSDWRRGLDIADDEDESRPTTSDGTIRGESPVGH